MESRVCITVCILLAIIGKAVAQVGCFVDLDCGGATGNIPTVSECCMGTQFAGERTLSYDDGTGCTNCPIKFGFEQTTLTGEERSESYSVNVGFLSGTHSGPVVLRFDFDFNGTAGMTDINLDTPFAVVQPGGGLVSVGFTLAQDSVTQEFNETITLILSPNFGSFDFIGPNDELCDQLNVTIIDMDVVEFELTEEDYRADEAPGAFMPVLIEKDQDITLANPVLFRIIPLTAQQALDQGFITPADLPAENLIAPNRADEDDFNTTVFTVSFPADEGGQIIQNVPAHISIIDDEDDEAEEQVFVAVLQVVEAVNVNLLSFDGRRASICIIVDNDIIQIGFSKQVFEFTEGTPEQPSLVLVKDEGRRSEQLFRVGIMVDSPNTAAVRPAVLQTSDPSASYDYSIGATGPPFNFIEIDFPADLQSLSINFTLSDDDMPEGLEGFQASVSAIENFPNFQLPPSSSTTSFLSALVQILDDDLVTVGFEQLNYTVAEGDGSQEICVVVTNPLDSEQLIFEISLEYATLANGTADASDFVEIAPTLLSFPASPGSPNPRRRCFDVFISDDGISEEVESFSVVLSLNSSVQQDGVVVDIPVAEIFILDDDDVVIGFLNDSYEVNEEDGSVTIEVGLIGGTMLQREISMLLSFVDDTATNGSDYVSEVELLTFNTDNSNFSISLPLINDDVFELTERLQAVLMFADDVPPERASVDLEMASVVIFDDDILVFGFANDTYQVTEDALLASPSVSLISGDPGGFEITLTIATDDSSSMATAAAGLDYLPESGSELTFSRTNTSSLPFDVTIIDDDLTERTESFQVSITGSTVTSAGVELIPTSQESDRIMFSIENAQVFIIDTDTATIGFAVTEYNSSEDGGPVLFELGVLEGELAFNVSILFSTSDGTATADSDFTEVSQEFTLFGTEDLLAPVDLVNDGTVEATEQFSASLAPVGGQLLGNVNFDPTVATVNIMDDDELEISLVKTREVPENTNSTVCVQFSANFSTDFNINVLPATPVNATAIATAGEDYLAPPTTILAEGNTHGPSTDLCFEVQIINDEFVEEIEECFALAISLPSPETDNLSVSITGDSTATCCIQDDDSVTIGLDQAIYEFSEDDNEANLTVSILSGSLMRPVMVTLSLGNDTAIAGEDFINDSPFPITFTESLTSVQIPLNLIDDSVHEASEEFLASLSTEESSSVVSLSPVAALVRILDNDDVQFTFRQDSYTFNKSSGLVSIFVDKVGQTDLTIELMVTGPLQAETAARIDQVLTFGPSDTQMAISFTVQDNMVALEEPEVLEWSLSVLSPANEDGVGLGSINTISIFIIDDDIPVIGFEQTQFTVVENDTVGTEVCVSVMAPPTLGGTVTVMLVSMDGTARAGEDYEAVSTLLTFNADDDQQCVNLTIISDDVVEGTENFTLLLSSSDDIILSPEMLVVEIFDSGIILVEFAEPSYTLTEEDGVGTIEVTKSDSVSEPFSVRVLGVLSSASDIVRSVDNIDTEIEFQAGLSAPDSIFITFNLSDDEVALEATEMYEVSLEVVTARGIVQLGAQDQTVVSILDTEVLNVGFGRPSVTVNESDGEFMMCVLKDRETVFPVEVTISTSSGTATEGADYDPANIPASITIPANEDMTCFTTDTVLDDLIALEEDEVFSLDIENVLPDDPRINVEADNVTVTILDDDVVNVGFGRPSVTVNESDGEFMMCVLKDRETAFPVEVTISTSPNTATEGEDYDPANIPASITIPADEDMTCFTTDAVLDDQIALEEDEVFSLDIENVLPDDPRINVEDDNVTVTILDDDVVNVGFGRASVTVNESDGEFMMCVLKDRETVFPVQVTISVSAEMAEEGEDYDPANVPSTVTIAPNSSMECFTSNLVLDDGESLEEDEIVVLSIAAVDPDDSRIVVSNVNVTVVIIDDDELQVITVQFEQSTYTAEESSGVVQVCLVKDVETAESFTVDDITTSEGTATDGVDYIGGPYNVTFGMQANDRQCIDIPLIADDENEISENFTVSLNLPTAENPELLPGDPAVATVNIIDPDDTVLVNDTIVGDPLFTVPILVSEDQLQALNVSELFMCYEIHGLTDQWFNLVTDECTSVNARYGMFNQDLNVIDEIGVRAVDTADQCVNIRVDVGNCTADVNDAALDVMGRYSMNGVSVRRYRNRVRISVPNCNDLTLVMWVFCETRTLQDPVDGSEVTGDMIKFVVMRGLNTGNRPSHGLLGQFWNIPVSIAPYNGLLLDNSPASDRYVINMTTSGGGTEETRSYIGWLYGYTWEFQEGPCLYVGSRQGGPIYEVDTPNDNVIEEGYERYRVDSAFSEDGFSFGIFAEDRCELIALNTGGSP